MNKRVWDKQGKMALVLLIWHLPKFLMSFIAALASRWMVVWLEFVEQASIIIPVCILAVLSWRLGRNLKYRFNYGTGKVEAITALFSR